MLSLLVGLKGLREIEIFELWFLTGMGDIWIKDWMTRHANGTFLCATVISVVKQDKKNLSWKTFLSAPKEELE